MVEHREALFVDRLDVLEHVAHRETLLGQARQVPEEDRALSVVGADLEEVAADPVLALEPVQLDEDAEVERGEPPRHRVERVVVRPHRRRHPLASGWPRSAAVVRTSGATAATASRNRLSSTSSWRRPATVMAPSR